MGDRINISIETIYGVTRGDQKVNELRSKLINSDTYQNYFRCVIIVYSSSLCEKFYKHTQVLYEIMTL